MCGLAQSCIKVAIDFVSPESLQACFKLAEEFRVLPDDHTAKEDKLGVSALVFLCFNSTLSLSVIEEDKPGVSGFQHAFDRVLLTAMDLRQAAFFFLLLWSRVPKDCRAGVSSLMSTFLKH